jgi:hypothetical protein
LAQLKKKKIQGMNNEMWQSRVKNKKHKWRKTSSEKVKSWTEWEIEIKMVWRVKKRVKRKKKKVQIGKKEGSREN